MEPCGLVPDWSFVRRTCRFGGLAGGGRGLLEGQDARGETSTLGASECLVACFEPKRSNTKSTKSTVSIGSLDQP